MAERQPVIINRPGRRSPDPETIAATMAVLPFLEEVWNTLCAVQSPEAVMNAWFSLYLQAAVTR